MTLDYDRLNRRDTSFELPQLPFMLPTLGSCKVSWHFNNKEEVLKVSLEMSAVGAICVFAFMTVAAELKRPELDFVIHVFLLLI